MDEEMMTADAEQMTGMAAPAEGVMEPTMEETPPMIDMETLMGNFMDMPEDRRQIATRLIATPAAEILDEIIGEPVITRLREQLGEEIPMGEEEAPIEEPSPMPTTDSEGLMGPTETGTAPLA